MAAPVTLEVSVDSTEYSRYETNRDTITATVVAVGGDPYSSESIRVDLVKARRARDAVVATATVVINGSSPQVSTATFYLPDIVDQDLISLIRFGKYFIRATSVTNDTIVGESPDFNISVITVEKFKEDYLFGVRLFSTEIKYVKYQPTNITGVTVTEVSKLHQPGFGTLNYIYNSVGPIRQLSWNGGPPVTISNSGNVVLRGKGVGPLSSLNASSEYIVVKVSSLAVLPTSNTSDNLIIEEKQINDSTIQSYIEKSIAWVENDYLCIYVEPTNIVTTLDSTTVQYTYGSGLPTPIMVDTDWDFIHSPLTYFAPKKGAWVSISTPYMQLLRVDSLFGVIAGTRVIDIDLNWVNISRQGGLIQLVPFNQEVAFNYLGLLWNSTLHGAAELPNFWFFNLIAGLMDCPADVRDLIAKKAAIDLLTILGTALRPGMGSVSLSRDGVSESVSYLGGQKYGAYNGAITVYKEFIEVEGKRLRAKYRGAIPAIV